MDCTDAALEGIQAGGGTGYLTGRSYNYTACQSPRVGSASVLQGTGDVNGFESLITYPLDVTLNLY